MLNHPVGMGARSLAAHPQPLRENAAAQSLGHGVFPHRQVTHHAYAVAVFRDARHTLLNQPSRRYTHRLALQGHRASGGPACTTQQIGQRHLAVARHPRHRDNFARVKRQRNVAQTVATRGRFGSDADTCQHTNRRADLACRVALRRRDGVANHPLRQLGLICVGGAGLGHQLACAQHRHPVRHTHDLAEFVTDENNGQTLGHHLAQGVKQGFALLRRQDRGGLIQNQDAGTPVQRLQNLDPLALPH